MRLAALATTVIFLSVASHPSEASAFCRLTTAAPLVGGCQLEGVPLEWRRACIPFSIDERGSALMDASQIQEVVSRSFLAWTEITCDGVSPGFNLMPTAFSTCLENQFHVDGGNVNTIAFVEDWVDRGYDPAAYALTTTWFRTSSGEILDADMQINETKGNYVECPTAGCTPGGDDIDLENTVTHELGHFFGLAHSAAVDATMFSTARNGDVDKRDLAPDDIAGFCDAYGEAAFGGECGFSPPGGLELNCEDPGCGCSIPGARGVGDGHGTAWLVLLGLLWYRRRRCG